MNPGNRAAVRAGCAMAGPGLLSAWLLVGAGLQVSPVHRRPDVVYQPTPDSIVAAMLNLAQVTSRDVVYDLGSGDGRIPIAAARLFGARGVGIEIEPNLIRRANDNGARAGVAGRVVFRNEDFFEAQIGDATVVTLFLFPEVNRKLMPKLQRELRKGARIVAFHFPIGDEWPPDMTQDVDGQTIYLWTVR
jgi:tRNA A58 N-methylase Trm61